MKTFSQKTAEIKREWFVIDASTLPLGKLAVVIADKLMSSLLTPRISRSLATRWLIRNTIATVVSQVD